MHQSSSLRRQVKNMVNNYTEAEVKVREATSNDTWGPSSSLMSEIADLTFNVVAFTEVMGMIWKRLNDHGKNWRHVYKALTLLDYLIKTGSERVVQQCRENIYTIQTLRDFQYIDRDGRDQGVNVREKAKQLVALIRDEEKLKRERAASLKTKERMAGAAVGSVSMPPPYPGRRTSQPSMASLYGEEFSRSRGSPSSFQSSSSSPRLAPDLEQARPQTSGEEELQLQLALAMSREESEKPPPPVDIDEQAQLQIAMNLSKEEAKKTSSMRSNTPSQRGAKGPPPPVQPPAALDMDEEMQLQIALNLSKEEHQQEQRTRQGNESLLQKALEESKQEMAAKGGSAFMDLVDVFAVPSETVHRDNNWGDAQSQASARLASTDPWDSLVTEPLGESTSYVPKVESPWKVPPTSSSPAPAWERTQSPPDPWEAPHNNVPMLKSTGQAWASPAKTAVCGVDPFLAPTGPLGTAKAPSLRAGSPSDADLFDDAMDGGQMNVNGRGDGCPEMFDLSHLGESLAAPNSRTCVTPEAFLGPTAASLVNLETLIPVIPSAVNKNPFLSGLSAPSITNPFQTEQPRLTLNQMGPVSNSPEPLSSLPYSASLPLPASHQPASLPSSLTHPTQSGLNMPGNLPQPLLPLSSLSTMGSQPDQHSQNPFL